MTFPATINPYRRFPGTAREAMETYRDIFGLELELMPVEGDENRVMHSELRRDGHTLIAASDTFPGEEHVAGTDTPLALTGTAAEREQILGYWAALSEGGTVTLELMESPWGATFGQLIDRFGTRWMFNIA